MNVLLLFVLLAPAAGEKFTPIDSKVALRGYFLAASARRDAQALGGFGPSENYPKRIDRTVPNERLSLVALPDEFALFHGRHGFRVLLVNATRKEIGFAASDSRISIVREARDAKGQWRPIEYLPSSWCGNSYHRVFLPAGHYWSFVAPEYSGRFATKMRFVLQREEGPLYSNEFDGWINLEQFDMNEGHTPTNIMDPYND